MTEIEMNGVVSLSQKCSRCDVMAVDEVTGGHAALTFELEFRDVQNALAVLNAASDEHRFFVEE